MIVRLVIAAATMAAAAGFLAALGFGNYERHEGEHDDSNCEDGLGIGGHKITGIKYYRILPLPLADASPAWM